MLGHGKQFLGRPICLDGATSLGVDDVILTSLKREALQNDAQLRVMTRAAEAIDRHYDTIAFLLRSRTKADAAAIQAVGAVEKHIAVLSRVRTKLVAHEAAKEGMTG